MWNMQYMFMKAQAFLPQVAWAEKTLGCTRMQKVIGTLQKV